MPQIKPSRLGVLLKTFLLLPLVAWTTSGHAQGLPSPAYPQNTLRAS